MWIHLGKPRITKKIDSIESGINELFLKFVPVSEKSSEASCIKQFTGDVLIAFMYIIGNSLC